MATPGPQNTPSEWAPRLASLIAAIRTDWDGFGIRAALRKVADRPLALVTLAAITAATERTDQRTPAIIAADGRHWHTLDTTPDSRGPEVVPLLCEHSQRPARCPQCAHPVRALPTPAQRTQMRADIAAAKTAHKAQEIR